MATASKSSAAKVECLNPNTGGRKNIDKATYDSFSKAIYHVLKKEKAVTFTQLVEGIEDCFSQQRTIFDGSVGWYAITVQKDMEARGMMEAFTEKGKKFFRLKNQGRPNKRP